MTPDYKTLLRGATKWRESFHGIQIELSHHYYRDGSEYPGAWVHPGIWCYYLHLLECAFEPEDWERLVMPKIVTDRGVIRDYAAFPDLEFSGGVTFYEVRSGFDSLNRRECEQIVVGCDYNHLWDEERGYPDTYDTVLLDAKNSVVKLREMFPDMKTCCEYSGAWDKKENFYRAKNDRIVHKSCAAAMDENSSWRPADTSTAESQS